MQKKNIFILLFLFFTLNLVKNNWCQELLVYMKPNNIEASVNYDYLNIVIKNNFNDTIFICLEPYNYNVINNSNDWIVSRYSNTFSPNRIFFINKNIQNYNEGTGSSLI